MNGAVRINPFPQDGNISFDDILRSVSVLETKEIVQFIHEMGKIVASRNANVLPQRESVLLKAINSSIPNKLQLSYESLNIKLNNETISEEEHQQLLKIIAKIELKKAKKLELMLELAQFRNISLKELILDGSHPPS